MKLRHLNLLLGMGACAARTGAVEVKPPPCARPPSARTPAPGSGSTTTGTETRVFALEGKVRGTFYVKYHHEYDPEGRQIFSDLKRRGSDRKVSHEEFSFVWDGCLIAESHLDAGPEGRETCVHAYDERGREIRRECHMNGDDIADEVMTVHYDAGGEETTEWDTDGDGDADRRRWQRRDARGHVLQEKNDSQADGVWDTIEAWDWSCPP